MNLCTLLLLLSIVFMAETPASATSSQAVTGASLTIDQAVNQAREQSPELRRSQAVVDEANWRQFDVLSSDLPQLRVSGQHLFSVKYQVLPVNLGGGTTLFPLATPGTIFTLGAYWTVFDGMETPYAYAAAKKDSRAAELEQSRADFELQERVKLRYYQALAAQELAEVADQNVRTLQDHLERTQSLLRQGTITRFDLLRTQVQLEEAIPERSTANDNVVIARQNLAAAMGVPSDTRKLAGALPTPVAGAVSPSLNLDVARREDIEALNEHAEAATELNNASHRGWFPTISLAAEKQYYNNQTLSLTDPYQDAYDVGISFTWTLFDLGGTIAKPKIGQARAAQAEARAEAAQIAAPAEFENWKRRFSYNVSLYQARRRAVEAAVESVRLAKIGYNAGSRTNTDVLDAELDSFRARAGVVQAQMGSAEALINLELALGRKLENGR